MHSSMTSASGRIDFRFLGRVEALRDGECLDVGGPRQRALLALLLLEPGRRVPADRLMDELWPGRPPPGGATLPSYVSRLRRALGPQVSINASDAGYAAAVDPEQVDIQRFERLVAEGQAALERGTAGRAVERFRSALVLWRGEPFMGVDGVSALQLEARRLDDVRLVALEGRIEADLALGGGSALVDELEALVHEHPYRERFWVQLMLALYRSQRQAEALEAYARARSVLASELGLEPGEELVRLHHDILRHEVAVAEPRERRDELPAPPSLFFGRESELDEIEHLLGGSRLVTLTGVGGVGKTRLALEVARRALPDFSRVVFVDLSGLSAGELVVGQVADRFDVSELAGSTLEELLATRIGHSTTLLLLDNCEHLREACGGLVATLLSRCGGLRVVATSRAFIGCEGETEYPVLPLVEPEAIELFLARARAVRPRLRGDGEARSTVAGICADLDCLPLAIELAAARARALSLEEIASRLGDRFRFLVSWRRLATARHRTLEGAMDWSYELLATDERMLLTRLSRFAGGFALPAVASVCFDGDEERAFDALEPLVAASLVVAVDEGAGTRYGLLETVRAYAAERLQEPDATAVAARHAAYYSAFVGSLLDEVNRRGILVPLRRLDVEEANLRVAFERFERAGGDGALRLAAGLWRWWWLKGQLGEGRERLRSALAAGGETEPAVRVEALRGASTLALRQADVDSALALATDALVCARATGDSSLLARAEMALANAVSERGEYERAESLYRDAAERFRGSSTWEVATALLNLGDLALNRGDLDEVDRAAGESLALMRGTGDDAGIAVNLGNLAFAALERGDPVRAAELLLEGLERSSALGFPEWVAIMLVGLAATETAEGDTVRAARLLGAAARLQAGVGLTFGSFEARVHDRTHKTITAALGRDRFAEAFALGKALDPGDAVAEALASRV
jgi:predicted ATPase/DNA-binding SARP family transcriptional activator